MTIGVTGATGQLGRMVIDELKERVNGQKIVGLVRSVEKGANLGVEVRQFNYDNADSKALSGIDTLLLISGNELGCRARQHKNVIEAAVGAGVKRIVYTSLLRADTSTLSLAGEHAQTEEFLKKAGVEFTILRNGWYTENYTGSLNVAVATLSIAGSAAEGRISSAPRADYALAAAVVLTSTGHQGKTYELAGDSSYSLAELAAELSKQVGKNIVYNNMSESDYASLLIKVGVPAGFARAIASWDVSASVGDLFDESHQLSKLIGRPTTTMAQTVKQALSALA